MAHDPLAKWRPAEALPAITGAAAAFLSIVGAKVILHSPMWCAAITEMRLEAAGVPCEGLFSTFVEEDDLFFGGEEALREALLEAQMARGDALLGIAVNCAPALIGDDVRGVAVAFADGVPVAVAEAGGFTGEFDDGYAKAFLSVLEALAPPRVDKRPNTVNLIGFSAVDHDATGTLQELKRLLSLAKIKTNLILGEPETSLESIRQAGCAQLNVIVHEARGGEIARALKTRLKQPFITAPIPHGSKETREWLATIASYFGLTLPSALEKEIDRLKADTPHG